MKIPAHKGDAFLTALPAGLRILLFFGPDEGVKADRIRAVKNAFLGLKAGQKPDPFATVDLDGGQLDDDPARLSDEFFALSLMGGRRVITVSNTTDKALTAVENVLENPMMSDNLIVLNAGDLPPRSKLRAACEHSALAAALGCYADEGRDLTGLIQAELQAAGKTVEAGVLQYLTQSLNGNRLLVKSELAKLVTYAGAATVISLNDAQACIGNSLDAEMEEMALLTFDGNLPKLDESLTRLFESGANPASILFTCARHMKKLMLSAHELARTGNMAEALAAQKPPIFYKNKDRFTAQLRNWPFEKLLMANEILLKAELQVKTTGLPAQTLCRAGLLKLCSQARTPAPSKAPRKAA